MVEALGKEIQKKNNFNEINGIKSSSRYKAVKHK